MDGTRQLCAFDDADEHLGNAEGDDGGDGNQVGGSGVIMSHVEGGFGDDSVIRVVGGGNGEFFDGDEEAGGGNGEVQVCEVPSIVVLPFGVKIFDENFCCFFSSFCVCIQPFVAWTYFGPYMAMFVETLLSIC